MKKMADYEKKSPQQRAFRGQRHGPLALPKIRTKAPRELGENLKTASRARL